ncbi:MAG: iron-sulfur cluster insertion protein ErpA [Acidobacteriota bacterium]
MITVTERAVSKVKELLEKENKAGQHLRVYVEGGGCSGFQYGLTFVDEQQEDDMVIECNGFKVLVDSTSAMYLNGAEVDFTDGLNGAGFKINNPNATSSCGCGQSFKV